MKLLKLFRWGARYPNQTIQPQVVQLIEQIEQYLINHSEPVSEHMSLSIVHLSLDLVDQFKPQSALESVLASLEPGYGFIPRSTAFIAAADGSWHFFIGIRRIDRESDHTNWVLWSDALARTNDARSGVAS